MAGGRFSEAIRLLANDPQSAAEVRRRHVARAWIGGLSCGLAVLCCLVALKYGGYFYWGFVAAYVILAIGWMYLTLANVFPRTTTRFDRSFVVLEAFDRFFLTRWLYIPILVPLMLVRDVVGIFRSPRA